MVAGHLLPTTPLCTSALLVPQHFQCRAWCHCPNLLKEQRRTAAPSYHIFINELPEVLKAMLFCDCVWIVAIFVGHTICLQCSRACQQQSGEVFQPISCRKAKQRWQFLIPLICEKRCLLESKLLSSSSRDSRWETDFLANAPTKAGLKTLKSSTFQNGASSAQVNYLRYLAHPHIWLLWSLMGNLALY